MKARIALNTSKIGPGAVYPWKLTYRAPAGTAVRTVTHYASSIADALQTFEQLRKRKQVAA